VTGTPLLWGEPADHCYGIMALAADDVTNVNFGFKQFVTAVGIYEATDPL